jgi:hypothetical protein
MVFRIRCSSYLEKAWMDSTLGEDASTTTREISRAFKESEMIKDLHEISMRKVQRLGQKIQPEWQGLTEEEFVYFCSYVDHDTLSQIENVLRDKNELRSN